MSLSLMSSISKFGISNLKVADILTVISGTVTQSTYNGYKVYTVKSNAQLTINSQAGTSFNIAVVGGGGGSGVTTSGYGNGGTGAGAGGNVTYYQTSSIVSDTINITVGNGGAKQNSGGTSSITFTTNTSNNRSAIGGGPGANYGDSSIAVSGGNSGGSGADAAFYPTTVTRTSGNRNQAGTGTNRGGNGGQRGSGGGAGAGGAGYGCGGYIGYIDPDNNGNANIAFQNNSTGTTSTKNHGGDGIKIPLPGFNPNLYFGGGGGGTTDYNNGYVSAGNGGKGGGGGGGTRSGNTPGNGNTNSINPGTNGTNTTSGGNGGANTGGGAGGAWYDTVSGSNAGIGGSGVVIITFQ